MDEQEGGLSGDCLGEEIVIHEVPVGFLEFRLYLVHDDGWCDGGSDNGGCFIYLVCPIACQFDVSSIPVASNVSDLHPLAPPGLLMRIVFLYPIACSVVQIGISRSQGTVEPHSKSPIPVFQENQEAGATTTRLKEGNIVLSVPSG